MYFFKTLLSSYHEKAKHFNVFYRGGTVHRCHGSVRTSVQGSRFDTILVQQENKMYYARFLFIYIEQTVVQIAIYKKHNVLFSLWVYTN